MAWKVYLEREQYLRCGVAEPSIGMSIGTTKMDDTFTCFRDTRRLAKHRFLEVPLVNVFKLSL